MMKHLSASPEAGKDIEHYGGWYSQWQVYKHLTFPDEVYEHISGHRARVRSERYLRPMSWPPQVRLPSSDQIELSE
jgi:hypothetical protein